jgi:hypothetical protein
MPEVSCNGETRKDGVKICTLHGQPLIGKADAQAKGFTERNNNAEWFCPVSGSGLGSFKESDAHFDELAGG